MLDDLMAVPSNIKVETFLDYFSYPQIFLHDYEHHSFRLRHAKGLSDAESSIIKAYVDRQIAQNDCLIQSAEDFVDVCQKMLPPK